MSYFSNLDLEIKELIKSGLLEEYISIYKREDKAILRNMRKALEMFGGFMNSAEDNIRLMACKRVLSGKA